MGLVRNIDERGVIPRWRGLKIADETGELQPSQGKIVAELPFQSKAIIIEQIKSWSHTRDLFHASDLLTSAFTLGIEGDFQDVAKYIIEADIDDGSPIQKIARRVLKLELPFLKDTTEEVHAFTEAFDKTKFYPDIRKYRAYLKKEAKNPIAWIELGRLYSMIGRNDKAEKCVNRALFLDKDNRFIVRSASRFFHHFYPDGDKALNVIKRSEFVKEDPWLLSAEIAYSSILERHSTFAKTGINFIKNRNYDYRSITELTSALGTLELSNGKVKDAKKLFSTSLIDPNDNTVAQASWAAKDVPGINVQLDRYELPLAYEAHAQLAYNEGKYEEAYAYALQWLNDEAFSARSIIFASHIMATFLNNPEQGIEILRQGLSINPEQPSLNNNLIYYLAKNGQQEEASHLFHSKLKQHIEGNVEINPYTVVATAGLLAFRDGKPEEGRALYHQAIELMKRKGKGSNNYYVILAQLNLIEEELHYTNELDEILKLSKQAQTYAERATHEDVIQFYRKLKTEINAALNSASQK